MQILRPQVVEVLEAEMSKLELYIIMQIMAQIVVNGGMLFLFLLERLTK